MAGGWRKAFDVQHPLFRPLWLRLAIVALTCGWALFELAGGNLVWAAMFGAAGLYLAHQFLVAFDPDAGRDGD